MQIAPDIEDDDDLIFDKSDEIEEPLIKDTDESEVALSGEGSGIEMSEEVNKFFPLMDHIKRF